MISFNYLNYFLLLLVSKNSNNNISGTVCKISKSEMEMLQAT